MWVLSEPQCNAAVENINGRVSQLPVVEFKTVQGLIQNLGLYFRYKLPVPDWASLSSIERDLFCPRLTDSYSLAES